MFDDIFLWLGLVGLMAGLMVGISLLEDEGDSFGRNIMFSIGIACAMFVYLLVTGEKTPWSPFLLVLSLFVGGVASTLIAFVAGGNLRAAFVAGGTAGIFLQFMIKIFPPGSLGFTGIHDFPTAINILFTILVALGVYYLLRNWGKDGENWAG
ncbi:MAG TPA: hypothetical protein PKK96_16850 [Anaerolineales bacterium]|nr:hypothetical protein [Anaerolineales bacterium]